MSRFDGWSRWGVSIFSPRVSRPDPWLLMAVAGLVGIGLVMVLNATYFYAQTRFDDPYFFFKKQLFALGIGSVLLTACLRLRVRWLEQNANRLLYIAVGLLVAVLLFGLVRGGARRWLWIGPVNFQPSELAKVALVFYFARSIVMHREQMDSFFRGLLPHLLVVGLVAGLIVVQPNLSTAIVLGTVVGAMLFVGGARISHLAILGALGLAGAVQAVRMAPWRMDRIYALIDPMKYSKDEAYQLVQSRIAFGSGGLTGAGLGQGQQKMGFLPEAHTDFIFSVVAEDFGVLGAIAVIALFAVVGIRGFMIAARHPDPFASLLAFGITATLLVQASVNIGVAIGLLPTTGMALPFVSYGGSALIIGMLQVGILAALSRMSG
jgi:cell division protein FtsW